MRKISIASAGHCIPVLVEEEAHDGVKKVAEKSADDICLLTGIRPAIISAQIDAADRILLYATIDKSRLLKKLEDEKKVSLCKIRNKREVFGIFLVDEPFAGIKQALVICGSDKRGTIYGIFHLSEKLGVSPLVFWGDARPEHRAYIEADETIEMISKEPSVRYRGFFINDEWPCFGSWCFHHFGGFTARMYDCVFELLLRLKGNYMWPAMWTSSFHLDGPGEESAILADMYGIIMGTSHHEPCSRASEEWDLNKGEKGIYGEVWDYSRNKEGLLEYWKDGLLRSSPYENIITVGMRGERDSKLQGTTSLAENIQILKNIIAEQDRLIERFSDKQGHRTPRLLAIYKEVEKYYYGSYDVAGLKEWEGLNDKILMFCDDNYGNVRFLPDEEQTAHKGGFGLYYHLDYHGGPISYEWINTSPLPKIREQMTCAFEYGIRDVWMVNAGDIKGNELPLSYFMDLAYDFESWGTKAFGTTDAYTLQWVGKQFGAVILKEQYKELASLLTESVRLISLRRPEALHPGVYHPVHFHETDNMLMKIKDIQERAEDLKQRLPAASQAAYYSLIHQPLKSGMNLIQMHLLAGKNELYARQGKVMANKYRDLVEASIQKDKELSKEFANAFCQKWKGMELSPHIGFTKWNDDGSRYPLRITVEPKDEPQMIVSLADREATAVKNYGEPDRLIISDFLDMNCSLVQVEVANGGSKSFLCSVLQDECAWVSVSWQQKQVEDLEILTIFCDRNQLPKVRSMHEIYLVSQDTRVRLVIYGEKMCFPALPGMTFLLQNGFCMIYANHFAYTQFAGGSEFRVMEGYGKTGCGLKAFPVRRNHAIGSGPVVVYQLYVQQEGNYTLEIWSAPSNPMKAGSRLCFGIRINDLETVSIPSVSKDYRAGEPDNTEWCEGVLCQLRKTKLEIFLKTGINRIGVQAVDDGFVLEGLLVYQKELPVSYLGPKESVFNQRRAGLAMQD